MWLSRFRLARFAAALGWKSAPACKARRRPPLTPELLEDRKTPAVITPTTFADGIGIGSLRDAILQANSNDENNTIVLSAGTYQLTVARRNETAGRAGDLNLTAFGSTETIQGAGANKKFPSRTGLMLSPFSSFLFLPSSCRGSACSAGSRRGTATSLFELGQ
jgi:hypothetical protein